MTKKLNKNIFVPIVFLLLVLLLLLVSSFRINCIFKSIFHIPCPSCGLSRAFKLILNLKIIESFSYSIIAFPLFVIVVTGLVLYIIGLIKKSKIFYNYLNFFVRNYIFIIIYIIISWIYNIIFNI